MGKSLLDTLEEEHYRGLRLSRVSAIAGQILEGVVALREAGVVHCDLKPENILFESRKQRSSPSCSSTGTPPGQTDQVRGSPGCVGPGCVGLIFSRQA